MSRKLRFSPGDWPSVTLLKQYPNWEYALDEEGEEGQDETTIRPAKEQTVIDSSIAFTAGEAILADGMLRPAILAVYIDPVSCQRIDVFVSEKDAWALYHDNKTRLWAPFVKTWLPEEERGPVVSLQDESVFPLKIRSRLPIKGIGNPFSLVIGCNGESWNE